MKVKIIIILCFVSHYLNGQIIFKADSLLKTNVIQLKAIGLGGHTGECISVEIKNLSKNAIYVEIESGRRFVSLDSSEQDILIVKPYIVNIQPFKIAKSKLFGFCCQSSMSSPKKNSAFYKSYMAPLALQKLTNYLSKNSNIDIYTMQTAIWTLSNNLNVSKIGNLNTTDKELRKYISNLQNIETPWYNITYNEAEFTPGTDFNKIKPLMFNAEIEIQIPHSGILNAYIIDKNKQIKNYLLNGFYSGDGKRTFIFKQSLKSYKRGKYKLIIQNNNGLYIEKEFEI